MSRLEQMQDYVSFFCHTNIVAFAEIQIIFLRHALHIVNCQEMPLKLGSMLRVNK